MYINVYHSSLKCFLYKSFISLWWVVFAQDMEQKWLHNAVWDINRFAELHLKQKKTVTGYKLLHTMNRVLFICKLFL